MHVQEAVPLSFPPFGDENSHGRQHHYAEDSSVDQKLDEEFKRGFRHDSANPGAEVVHFVNTTVHFAAVVSAVRLVAQTARAERRTAVRVADEDIPLPEMDFGRAGLLITGAMVRFVLFSVGKTAVIGSGRLGIAITRLP